MQHAEYPFGVRIQQPLILMVKSRQELRRQQRTILHVDCYAPNILLIEELISLQTDWQLATATTGKQCLLLAAAVHPDVILMEIRLQDIGGIELLKQLQMVSSTAHIPVIALSSNAMPEQIEKALRAGFFSYLTKPYRLKEVIQTIEEALEFSERCQLSSIM